VDASAREPGSVRQRVALAVQLTVEAGSARLQHGPRIGAPDGPSPPTHRPREAWIDLRRRRAWPPEVRALAGENIAAEQFWDGATLYVRFAPTDDWEELPFMRTVDVPAASAPYSSPLWRPGQPPRASRWTRTRSAALLPVHEGTGVITAVV
jgi:hypothetical protein